MSAALPVGCAAPEERNISMMTNLSMIRAAFVSFVLLPTVCAAGTTWHVDDDACPGSGTGTEVDPFCSIQAAIDAAADGDEIVVAPGTYYEAIDLLGKPIHLRSSGGHDVTTIDATGLGRSVITCVGGQTEPTIVDGFTVTGGAGTPYGQYDALAGGGLFAVGANVEVRDCLITGNSAVFGGGLYADDQSSLTLVDNGFSANDAWAGGAVRTDLTDVTITNCQFVNNSADNSGGAVSGWDGTVTIERSTFENNMAQSAYGGAVQIGRADSSISDCIFRRNVADDGGAVKAFVSDVRVSICDFNENEARASGGAVWAEKSKIEIESCSFMHNCAGLTGGAVYTDSNESGSINVRGCTIEENSAGESGGGATVGWYAPVFTDCHLLRNKAKRGGGLAVTAFADNGRIERCMFDGNLAWGMHVEYLSGAGGGLFAVGMYDLTVAHSVFSGNRAASGAGAYLGGSGTRVASCSFVGNSALEAGGGLTDFAINGELENVLLYGNSAGISGAQIAPSPYPSDELSVSYCDVEGSGGSSFWDLALGTDLGGNLDVDPMFVRAPDDGGDGWGDDPETLEVDEGANDDYGDLRLMSGSPCINAGDPVYVAEAGETDLDGHPRVLCGRVDMGAYEFGIGDYDCNHVVELFDFAAWASCMTHPGGGPIAAGCEAFDFNADAAVDLADYAGFQSGIQAP